MENEANETSLQDHWAKQREQDKAEDQYRANAVVGTVFYLVGGGGLWHGLNYATAKEIKVTKTTKAQIVFEDDLRISKDKGKIVGSGPYESRRVFPALPHIKERIADEKRSTKAKNDLRKAVEGLQDKVSKTGDVAEMEALAAKIQAIVGTTGEEG